MADLDTSAVPAVDFDIRGAMKAGYSEGEIASYLASQTGFDAEGARKAGYSDNDIVRHLMPPPPPKPPPPPAPESVSGTGKAMAKAAGQEAIEGAASVKIGVGALTKSIGQAEGHESATDVGLMRRLDQGEDFGALMKAAPNDLARLALREYQIATPERRARIRQDAMNVAAAPPGGVERAGGNILQAGHDLSATAKKTFPLTPEEESRSTVIATKMVAGLAKYIGAAAAGGMPAVVGLAGVDAYGKTYDEAKNAGSSDEDAAGAALLSAMPQAALMTVPIGQATKLFTTVPAAMKGDIVRGLATLAEGGVTLTAFSQISQLVDNVVAKNTYDPKRDLTQGLGEHLPETFAAGMVLPAAGHVAGIPARRAEARAQAAADKLKKIMEAPDVDTAITAARTAAEGAPIDVESIATQAREFGGRAEQEQASLLQFGSSLGAVEQATDGTYHIRTNVDGRETTVPLKVWDERAPAVEGQPTIAPALAATQRDHYAKMGLKIVYFENDPALPDGAFHSPQPDTIFLSNNPDRNVLQVAAHEAKHAFESVTLPDGRNAGDLLRQQVEEGMTGEGLTHALTIFGETAPERATFPEGAEGDAAHIDAVYNHIYDELGADIRGEAPKFQTYIPKVIDAVQARYGVDAAKDVVRKLMAGIKQAMETLRAFFFKPAEHAEYGQPETVSQHWVTNLGEIHDVLAKIDAERYGTQLEKEQAAVRAMRAKPAVAPEVPAAPPAVPAEAAPVAKAAPPETAAVPVAPAVPTAPAVPQRAAREPAAAETPRPLPDHIREFLYGAKFVGRNADGLDVYVDRASGARFFYTEDFKKVLEAPNILGGPTFGGPERDARFWAAREAPPVAARPEPPPRAATPEPAPTPAPQPTQLQQEQAAVRAMRERAAGGAEPVPERPAPPERIGDAKLVGENEHGAPLYERPNGQRFFVNADGIKKMEAISSTRTVLGQEVPFERDNVHRTKEELAATREHPVLPPEPAARPEPRPESPHAREAAPEHQLAERIADRLDEGWAKGTKPFTAAELQHWAEGRFGGTLASGAYSRDRLYDALELGVNRYIQRHPDRFSAAVDAAHAKEVAAELARIKESLPTQTVRAGEKDAYQQFSTPPDYAYAANWVANLRPSDHVLEPSAGVGGLLVHAMNAKVAETTGNEISDKRRGMLEALEPTRVTGEDAAQLHNILPAEVRPTVVLMNPPFSRAAERMGGKMVQDEGAKHIEQALARLEPGGRLVAIVGDGMKPEGTAPQGGARQGTGRAFRDWWAKIGKEYNVLANVGVDREIYTKYGTSFPTRFLVIDKTPPSGREMITGQVKDAAGLIEHLKEVRDERSTIQPVAGQPSRQGVAAAGEGAGGRERELPGQVGVVGPREGRGGAAAGGAEPAGAPQRGERGGQPAGSGTPEGGRGERVAPVEPEPGRAGTEGQPAGAAARGEHPGGGVETGGGDGLRSDGSGQRDEPGVTPAPEGVVATENAVTEPTKGDLTEAIYEAYAPQRLKIEGAKAHPGALVQSAAMAAVLPPKTDYRPRLPKALVKDGLLSDAQIEAVTYAGHAHSDVMPNGKRRGFFIGDGTGVGKGREIAGILLDNKLQGRTKAVWISEKRALINDARRDWNGLGQPAGDILEHGKTKADEPIKATKGILFTSYDTLRAGGAKAKDAAEGAAPPRSRVDQIVDWLGKDFDGVIAFDESHNMGNATAEKDGRNSKAASKKALAGVDLQNKLPNARVVYVSATGATEMKNFAFADRLGLWGEGTPFPTREAFIGQVTSGGVAAMELVARDMKALGHYISRNLSYDGVTYDRVEHTLSSDQRVIYDKLAEGWQVVLQNFEKALQATGAVAESGKPLNGDARKNALSAFWGGHQRFFNQIITSMQMPSVIRGVERDLKEGRQSVLQLVNTNEASQERSLEKARKNATEGGELEDLDLTPKDQLMQLVEKSFPVQQMEEYVDDNGNRRSRPVEDSNGNPVLNKQAVAMRERLLNELGSIRVPDGPLEMLINKFGTEKVAEVTGRKQRVVKKIDEETGKLKNVVEPRGGSAAIADADLFQAGKKPILVFSEAGGTGRSYHAAIGSGSEDARRSHYLVQGGWQASKAVQGFGRTHRTNQASAPIFHLVTTDLQGQKRFISSIARRLGQLGALTKGERRTGDQGMFGLRDNLESTEARDALRQFFRDVYEGKTVDEGLSMEDLEKGMGLKIRDNNGELARDLPDVTKFMNRVLSLKIDQQNKVFGLFSDRIDQTIERAASAGTLDTGVEVFKADKLVKQSEQTVYTDPRSGAETKHVHLNAQNRNNPRSFNDTLAGRNKTGGKPPIAWVQNERSENVFAVSPAGTRTDERGNVYDQVRLTTPTDYQLVDRDDIEHGQNWKKIAEDQARPLWDQKVAATPEFRNSDLHIITGAVLPIWDRIGGSPKIFRLQTDKGERILGRVIPESMVDATLKRLGAEGIKVNATPAEIAERVLGGATAKLANDWTIKRSRVAGESRLELVGPDFQHREELARSGVFSERIQYDTRWFISTEPDAAAKAIESITKSRPVTSLSEPGGARFSPKSERPVDLVERIARRERQKAGTTGRDLSDIEEIHETLNALKPADLATFSDRDLDALHNYIETGALGSAKATEPLYDSIQDELDMRGRGAMRDRTANDGPAFSPRLARDFHANPDREYTPEQERFNERQRAVTVPTWGDWWNKATENLLTKATVATVDRYAGIKKRDPEGYLAARIANSSEGAKAVWLTQGTLSVNGKAYDLKDRNGGARELLKPLKKEVSDFFFWIASHRAGELAAEDRENRFTPEDIAAGKTLNRGQLNFDYELSNGKTTRSREAAYADALGKLNVLNQNILDISVKGGLLTREVADVLMKNQFYVPFFRERADGTAEFVGPHSSTGMAKQTFGKRLTGGTEKLNSDLVQNWVDNASHIIDAAAKNRAAHQTLEAGVTDGIATKITEQQYKHLSDKQQKAESTWVMVDGKKQYYHVEDPLLLKSIGTLDALADPFYALSASRVARRVLQVGVTHNPIFAVRNLTRDSMQALAVTPQSANVLKTIATGIRDSDSAGSLANLARSVAGRELRDLGLSDDAVRVLAGGGLMRIASLSDTGVSKVRIGQLLDTSEKLGGLLDGLDRAMHAYSESVGQGEGYNRIALYKNLREQGVAHDIASFSAQDLTDFSLSGANVIVRYIRETVPFTNSRAQGLYKVGRALSGSDAAMFKALDASTAAPSAKNAAAVTLLRTAGTLAGLTIATMALDAIYSDDPEYQKRNEYDRGNYWFFRVGEARFRVPMPFEVGALARIAADTALAFFDNRMTVDRWASNTWAQMQNNLGFGFVPQIASPLIDVAWTGKSGTGQAIEPRGMEHLRPDARYTVDNTMAARGASSVINSVARTWPGQGSVPAPSPMQLDYLTKAYGGWLASSVLGVADTAIRSFTSEPVRPATDTWSTVTQGMISTSPRSSSRYVDALYQQATKVEQAFATYKDILQRGQGVEAQQFFKDNQELIQKHGLVSSVTRLEGDLNRQIRLVTNNPDPRVTAEQKRIQIMQLQAIKNRAAEQAFGTPQSAPSARTALSVPDRPDQQDVLHSLTFGLMGTAPDAPSRDVGVKPETRYPGPEDVSRARLFDQAYGSEHAKYFEEGGADIRKVATKLAPMVVNDARYDDVPWEKVDKKTADLLYTASIAANRSAIASLGFDPRKLVVSPPSEDKLTAAGVFSAKKDAMWGDANHPSAFVHESIHRGIEILRQKGEIAESAEDETASRPYVSRRGEEMVVRALMLRNFGNVEKGAGELGDAQVAQAQSKLDSQPEFGQLLGKLESLAARQIQQRQPAGPR